MMAAVELKNRILLYIRAKGLKNLDVVSKSDPFAKVSVNGREVGKTEVKKNCLDPVWTTPIAIDYQFETVQKLHIEILDSDDGGSKKGEKEGVFETDLATVICSKGSSLTAPLTQGKGEITITAEEVKSDSPLPPTAVSVSAASVTGLATSEQYGEVTSTTSSDVTIINASANNLLKKDVFGKSDPFLIVSREIGGTMVEVFRTEVVKKTLDPTWNPITIATEKLGSKDKPLHIEVWDWDRVGNNDLIGTAESTDIFACAPASKNPQVDVAITEQTKKGDKKTAGTIHFTVERRVDSITKTQKLPYAIIANSPLATGLTAYPDLRSKVSFLDMMKKGLKIQTICAIDFTGSNGVMHDIGKPNDPNPYEVCIRAVGNVLQPYDSDGRFELYGYGAKQEGSFPPFFIVGSQPECVGVDGLLETYRRNRSRLELGDMGSAKGGDMAWRAHKGRYYCDDFYQIINHVSDMAEKTMKTTSPPGSGNMPSQYFVLFFVIDGDGFDEEGTFRAIVRASALPMSIVLIGVGHSSFGNLSSYDADDRPIRTKEGVNAVRDIVQFVRFEDFNMGRDGVDQNKLAAAVLAEIPHQVESFVALYGINA